MTSSIQSLRPQPGETPLLDLNALARLCGVSRVLVKAENHRALGNFKSLGGFSAGMKALERERHRRGEQGDAEAGPLPALICASDGNHGLAVAAAAFSAGTHASVYLPLGVPPERAARIAAMGALIVWVSGSYDQAVDQARLAAKRGGGLLIADTTDDDHDIVVADVMDGYLTMASEIISQLQSQNLPAPTHLFLQAGVGGFAAAMADGLIARMTQPQRIIVVEPESAACVAMGLAHGAPVHVAGNLETCADMLSCGLASKPALRRLLHHRAKAISVNERALADAPALMTGAGGPATTPSGAAGLAGLLRASGEKGQRRKLGLNDRSVALLFVTEGLSGDARRDRP